jgi:hypothetical protein
MLKKEKMKTQAFQKIVDKIEHQIIKYYRHPQVEGMRVEFMVPINMKKFINDELMFSGYEPDWIDRDPKDDSLNVSIVL